MFKKDINELKNSELEKNRQIVYNLSQKKYPYISKTINGNKKKLYHFILDIYSFMSRHEPMLRRSRYTYIITTKTVRSFKLSCSKAKANQYLNFLVCMGLIEKSNQTDQYQIIDANKVFLKNNPDLQNVLGVFYLVKLTPDKMQTIEKRTKELSDSKITTSNLSRKTLIAAGLDYMADEVYPYNKKSDMIPEYNELKCFLEAINTLIKVQGYTTKDELLEVLQQEYDIKIFKGKRLFKLFRGRIAEEFDYHAPKKEDIQKYQLHDRKWIYTKRAKAKF